MNVIYQSENMTVVDDREIISIHDAIDLLIAGKTISVCDPPDYTAENEYDMFPMPFTYSLIDIVNNLGIVLADISEGRLRSELYQYLRGYELSN